jgi:C4-dicarboxylate-specific signal transduction histidine kinase
LLADLDLLFKSHNEIFRKSYFDSFKESSVIINNQELTVSVYANCVSTDKESFYPFYIRDITRQKKLELELVESRAMLESFSKMSSLGEMAGSIAHEINTPLAVIQMRAGMAHELISRKKFESDVLEKCITSIEQTTTKISSIVSGLRTFSRDSQNDSFVESSIKQIVDDTFVLCTERFKNNNVKIIRNEFEDKIISCQPNQISQVLLNLLNNAFDAIEKLDDRWVQVDLSSSNDSIYLAIIDSGSGISKDIQDKIMTPFFTTKERGKGTGLGLSISKKIIEAHGGKLSIDINCSNTKFIIELPTINEVNHG